MSRLWTLLGLFAVVTTVSFSEDLEIIVTASRIEEEARSSPSFVRVIPEKTISQGGTVLDALRTLPDIAIRETSPGKETATMGGFGENGFARTLILIDGRPVNRADMASVNWRTIPLDRVERIEVVKGPLSSQYGDQAIAGAVNIITKDPEGLEAWARAKVTTNFSNRQAAGAAWGGDVLRAEIGVSRDDINPTRDRSDYRVVSTQASVGTDLGPVSMDIRGSFADSFYELPGGLTKAQFDDDPDQAVNLDDEVQESIYEASLESAVELGPVNLAAPVSWRRVDSVTDMASWLSNKWTNTVLDNVQGSVQADMNLFLGDQLAVVPVLGVDMDWSKIAVDSWGEKARVTLNSSESAQRTEAAFWSRTKLLIGDKWAANAGLRVAWYVISAGSDEKDYSPVVYDAGVSWRPSEPWALSIRYGRVFRYPMLDEQASYYGFGAPGLNTGLDPEYGHHATVSAEYSAGAFTASAAPYFLAMFDEILYDSATFQNENIGDTYHYGCTVSADWTPGILGFRTSYSFDGAEFMDSGKTIPLVPAHTVVGRASVRPIDTVELVTEARYTSSFYKGDDTDNSQGTVDGRFVWNARVDWRPVDGLTVYTDVQNILDNRTPSYVYYSSWSGTESWYPSAGREFGFGADWSY